MTLSALVVAAGLVGLGAAAQAAPAASGSPYGATAPVERVQMSPMERRMMRRKMERRMMMRKMERRMMRKKMMRRGM